MAHGLLSCGRDRSQSSLQCLCWVVPLVALLLAAPAIAGDWTELSASFYDQSCPNLLCTVQNALQTELQSNSRVGASLLRLMFHDCFVQGCDGSVLLNDTATFTGEKGARANNNSLRGFDAFDRIKSAVEKVCPSVVSCADTLVMVAREAVIAAGGPTWSVELGRRDSLDANLADANTFLPLATDNVTTLRSKFSEKNLNETDMVALSGAHTFGKAQCVTFRQRLYNFTGSLGTSDPTLDTTYLATLEQECPQGGPTNVTVDLDQTTNTAFDNAYYSNLLADKGILSTDQTLRSGGDSDTAATVSAFATSQEVFFTQFAFAIVHMGRISPLTGTEGEIRTQCSKVNSWSTS